MKKQTVRTLTIVAGVLILLAVVGVASAVWLFTTSVDIATADEGSATAEFDRVLARFDGVTPVLELRDHEPVVTRRPSQDAARVGLTTLHVLHWDPDDDSFTRVNLPFWFLRLKSGTINIASDNASFSSGDLDLTVEDLERFGPTLLMHHRESDGNRLLIWTD